MRGALKSNQIGILNLKTGTMKLTKKQIESVQDKALKAYEELVGRYKKKPNMNHAITIAKDVEVVYGKTVPMTVQIGTLDTMDFWDFMQNLNR